MACALSWSSPAQAFLAYELEAFGKLNKEPARGQWVLGYRVTSGFGIRRSPCRGFSSYHRGVDLATPVGTKLHVPARMVTPEDGERYKARCRPASQTGGGGLVLEILMLDRGVMYQVLHLNSCFVNENEVAATTGNSGVGTGPHVDFRKILTESDNFDTTGKEFVPISEFEVRWFLSGVRPTNP